MRLQIRDEIIHRTQFAFSHNQPAADGAKSGLPWASAARTVNNDSRCQHQPQTVDFGGVAWSTLLPIMACSISTALTRPLSYPTAAPKPLPAQTPAPKRRRHIEISYPFDGAVSFVQRL